MTFNQDALYYFPVTLKILRHIYQLGIFRFSLRLALFPFLCLSAALFFIHAQPYDGHAVRAVLLADNCAKPCFMGIQPGVTTPQQALSQLRSSDLVSYVGVSESLQTVAWYWNKKPFSLMDDTQIPALFYDRNEVSSIQIAQGDE